jgi:hypothetical protein
LIVPVIVIPRRLSLSIGRWRAYDRSNEAPGIRRVRPYAVPSPSGISLISLLSITCPIVARPVSSCGLSPTTRTVSATPAGANATSSCTRSPTCT